MGTGHPPATFESAPSEGTANVLELHDQIQEAVAAIRGHWDRRPRAGIILGTGLGGVVETIDEEASIDYEQIPHFLRSTAIGHRGRMVCGRLNDSPVLAMEGRFHMYEGYPLQQITLPVRVMRAMGAELLIVTQACGGLNPQFRSGDIMIIEDHINLMGDNPLIGINDDRLGPRFPDMCRPYDPPSIIAGLEIARRENFSAHKGVTVAVAGPNLETRAEYRFLRLIGADVVGMSTVPEVIVAVHCGLRVFGLAIITDMCLADALEPADINHIVAVAKGAEPKLAALVTGILQREATDR